MKKIFNYLENMRPRVGLCLLIKFLLLSVLGLTVPGIVSAQEEPVEEEPIEVFFIEIPDANLAAAMRNALNLPPNALITNVDMQTLMELDYRGIDLSPDEKITDLRGLEFAINLEWLDLREHRISNLMPLQHLTNLTFLGLWKNQIIDVSPLQNLPNLATLLLDENQIFDMSPLQNLPRLSWLLIGGNDPNLDITPLQNLTNLKGLSLYSYQISDVSVLQNLMHLTHLWLGNNQITDVSPLAGLTNLTTLGLGDNQITDLWPLAGLTNLETLELGDNQITDVSPLAGLTNLERLELGFNTISDIWALAGLTNLERLELWENTISDIWALAGLTNLTDLRLSDNTISDIWALAGLTSLKHLHFDNNTISDIWALAGLTNMETLRLRNNQIMDVSALVDLVNLRRLYLNGNPIQDFSPLQALLAKNPGLEIDIDITSSIAFNPPTIADQTFTLGSLVNLTLPAATGGTPPYTYTLLPIPAGLAFVATSHTLAGIPTTEAVTDVLYTATDATGASASLNFTITVLEEGIPAEDVDSDGQITVIDLAIVALFYGTNAFGGLSIPADVNSDGIVDLSDLIAVARAIDVTGNSGALVADDVEGMLEAVAEQVNAIEGIAEAPARFSTSQHTQLSGVAYRNAVAAFAAAKHLATDDARLRKWMPLLKELLQLLTEMQEIPDTTALLPNYPNPFNPETWIPYRLATDAAVVLTIYDVRGSVVRELSLGHQAAGVYESRGRAAYWDGKNQHGEKVASGLYFYTLTAGEFSATRKMLIAK